MSFANRFSIQARLVALVGLALLTIGLLMAMAWVKNHQNANSVEHLTQHIYSQMDAIKAIDMLTKQNGSHALELFVVASNHRPAIRESMDQNRLRIDGLLAQLQGGLLDETGRRHLDDIVARRQAFVAAFSEALAFVDGGQEEEGAVVLTLKVLPALRALREPIEAMVAQYEQAVHAETERVGDNVASLQWQLLSVGLVAALALALLGWALVRSIVQALQTAMAVTAVVAEGDLTVQVPVHGEDELSRMLLSLHHMKESLAHILHRVQESATSVASASQQIAMANADLSARTETQAGAVQQTAASMEQLHTTVQTNTESTQAAHRLAAHATQSANEVGRLVHDLVATMDDLNRSSQTITDIVAVIDSIAFQTNILALNAAVEAARAGEQGRGFAVVAAEVRALAQRSGAAAREIKDIIQINVSKTAAGHLAVQRAGQTVQVAVEAIRKVSASMSTIEASSREQSSGIVQISQAVASMDTTTQQNAALVEETAAAAQSLDEQVQTLKAQIGRFKVSESPGSGWAAAPAAG
jgi:methyl-accepting chemotaxis protein